MSDTIHVVSDEEGAFVAYPLREDVPEMYEEESEMEVTTVKVVDDG